VPKCYSVVMSVLVVALAACSDSGRSLDEQTQELVVREIVERLDQYAADLTSKNLDAMLSFWSDSSDFVFAGDGVVLGGFEDWVPITTNDNDQTERWIHWTWSNVHILPLARNAASATLEFDYEKVLVTGETTRGYGSWTYVMQRTESGWQVFHGNGHHIVR
jgi:hypothetical protein